MPHKTIAEQAREQGVSVSTIKRRIKQKVQQEQYEKAKTALHPKTAGWNPMAGSKRKL